MTQEAREKLLRKLAKRRKGTQVTLTPVERDYLASLILAEKEWIDG